MITYEVKLNRVGEITNLPDSQRLFGFLVSLLYNDHQENQISSFVQNIYDRSQHCMVSNLFPTGYYPTPKDYLLEKLEQALNGNINPMRIKEQEQREIEDEIEQKIAELDKWRKQEATEKSKEELRAIKTKKEKVKEKITSLKEEYKEKAEEINQLSTKEIYETIKKMDFIRKEDLSTLLNKSNDKNISGIRVEELKKIGYIKKTQTFVQKFRLESQIEKLPGFPNVAYSLPILSFIKQGKQEGEENGKNQERKERQEREKSIKEFSFLVSTDKESILSVTLENLKNELSQTGRRTCILGAKGSSGYNEYQMTDIQTVKNPVSKSESAPKRYINLGMLLPDESAIDWQSSTLDIFSSNRKSFEIADEISKVISFIVPGSVIQTQNDSCPLTIGRSISNEYNLSRKNAIIFGNSFIEELEEGYEF